MTTFDAQQIGMDIARAAYRQWDRVDDPSEIVFRACQALQTALISAGITPEFHDDLFEAAGEAFRTESEQSFGHDYVVAGQ